MGGNVDDALDVGLGAAVGTEVLVGTGVSVGVTSSPAAIGVGPACPPPQPTANKIDAIPAISRPTLNNFISYPPGLRESPAFVADFGLRRILPAYIFRFDSARISRICRQGSVST
jgi:hypothetical protein